MYSVSSVRQTTKVALQPFLESSRICACTVERFKRYLETDLLPHLNGNSVLAMDNMKSHHAKAVKELLDSSGVRYIYLPPYSPDLNPIEKLWSKIKALLRKFKARNHHPAPTARLHSAKRRAAFISFSVICSYFICGVSFRCRLDLRYSSSVRLTTELAVLESAIPTSCSSSRYPTAEPPKTQRIFFFEIPNEHCRHIQDTFYPPCNFPYNSTAVLKRLQHSHITKEAFRYGTTAK